MTVKVILFDFDGTIADTFEAIVKITNRLAEEFGYKQSSPEEVSYLRSLNSRQIIKYAGVSIFKLPLLVRKVKAELSKDIENLVPIFGMKEALLQLKKQGYTLGILTSNSPDNVAAFLENNDLLDLFNFIYAEIKLLGKKRAIKKFLKQEDFKPEEIVYVGDETRDIEAARENKVKAIAVSWGFNSSEVLADQAPDFLIHHPQELVELFTAIGQNAL